MAGERMDSDERAARLREIEAELDAELELDSGTRGRPHLEPEIDPISVAETAVKVGKAAKKASRIKEFGFGKLALASLAVGIAVRVLGAYLINLLGFVAMLAFIGFGVLWIIEQLGSKKSAD
ncbi:MAG: hypothetical protein IT204_15940 [Fimbriimonadaceae bacterium]|nr:hypothetical protein [Fimbriimonadaceae bacterium]